MPTGVLSIADENGVLHEVPSRPGGVQAEDVNAIHSTVANEIAIITEKALPVSADLVVIEDSASSFVKARVQLGSLPGGGDVTAAVPFTADEEIIVSDGAAKGVKSVPGTKITATGITIPGLVHTWGASEAASITNVFSQAAATGTFSWVGASDLFEFPDTIRLQAAKELQLRDAAIRLFSPADGDVKLEADDKIILNVSGATDSIELQMSGARVADFNANGFLAIGDAPLITDAEVQLHLASNDDRVLATLQVADTDTTQNPRFIFRKSGGTVASPSSVVTGENVGLIRFELHNGTAFVSRAQILARTVGTDGAELQVATGSGGQSLAFTVLTSGDIRMDGTNEITLGDSGQRIFRNTGGSIRMQAALTQNFYIGGTQELVLTANTFKFDGAAGYAWDWSVADHLTLKDNGGSARITIDLQSVGFNGAEPVGIPDYTITNPTTNRSIDVSGISLANLAEVVGTLIQDFINNGLLT